MSKDNYAGLPLRITLIYLVIASIYIYVSDQLLLAYVTDHIILSYYQTYKGWAYVLVTALMLFILLNGQIKHLSAEIEKRKRLEKAERETSRYWQQTVDASAEAICLLDKSMNILRANQAMADMVNIKPDDLVGLNCYEALHGVDESIEDCPLLDANELPVRKEHELILRNRCYIVNMNPVFNETGKLQHTVHIMRDITNRKKNEENIRSQRNALNSLYSLSTIMRSAKSSDELLDVVINEVLRLFQADDAAVLLLSNDRKYITIVKAKGLWSELVDLKFPSDKGLSGKVLQTGEPFVTNNYSTEKEGLSYLEEAGKTGPMALIPLSTETGIIGTLEVSRRVDQLDRAFSSSEVKLISAIGELAGNALRRQALFESAQSRLKQLQGLRNIDAAIAGSLDLNLIFNVILNEATSLLMLDGAAILRFEHETNALKYSAVRGFYSEKATALTLQPGQGYAGNVLKNQKPVYISNLIEHDRDQYQSLLLESEGFVSYFAVPLVVKGRVKGVLEVYSRKQKEINEEWLEFLQTLARQTAIAIDNAELFQNMENFNLELLQAYDATIEGWAYALDLRDEETEEHSQRVTEVTLMIARKMGVKESELVHIKRGALLHDIGKMGVPDSILLKPGPLNDQQWEIMRKHPNYAYDMLAPIDYLRPALDIPYCHHEKWDGSGYPRGLKGKQIPLPARIFAVVDVHDALTSERPYRKAWGRKEALDYIKEESGKHFDPEVVKRFLEEIDDSA